MKTLWPLLILLIVFVVLLVLLPFLANKGERSPWRRPWALGVVLVAVIMISTLWIAGEQAAWSPNLQAPELPGSVTAQLSGSAAFGTQLFRAKGCQACHSLAGSGGERGPDLTTVGARLSREQLTWRILNGGTNMPAYGQLLRPDETAALVDFLAAQRGR